MSVKKHEIKQFRRQIENVYAITPPNIPREYRGSFDEILCYELHTQPINPRMRVQTMNQGFHTGLTFKELAAKWGISVTFLGELIADHCKKLEE